jgi:hypothetical protein
VDNLFPLLLFLIFILAPLIEQLRKKGQQQPPPPPARRPLPRAPQQRSETEEEAGRPAEPAATMIPDELWQILTGERRPPEPPPPPPETQPSWDVVYVPPEETEEIRAEGTGVSERLDVQVRRMRREEAALQAKRRRLAPVSLEEVPIIQSLEVEPLAEEARHTAFHTRMATHAEPATVAKVRKPILALNSRAELQRAFVLTEVLGTPRGLE